MTDTEILNTLLKTFEHSLYKDIPNKREKYKGEFAEGYIKSMEMNAKYVIGFIKDKRGEL